MRYLITSDFKPFYTNWFDIDNNFNSELGMVVYDLQNHLFYDGEFWKEIEEDHL